MVLILSIFVILKILKNRCLSIGYEVIPEVSAMKRILAHPTSLWLGLKSHKQSIGSDNTCVGMVL